MKMKLLMLAVASVLVSPMALSGEKVLLVDTSGKPPFKRQLVDADSIDVAQFEQVDLQSVETERRMVVTMQGKPPHRRQVVDVPVIDVAQFETVSGEASDKLKGSRPPFKR